MPNIESSLFEKTYFYFHPDFKTFPRIRSMKRKIISNTGNILIELKPDLNLKIHCIVPDGYKDKTILDLKKSIKNSEMVSTRWVEECLSKKHLIKNPRERKFIHLLPFKVPVPISSFAGKKIIISGFDSNKNYTLERVAEAIGMEIVEEEAEAEYLIYSKNKINSFDKEYLQRVSNKVKNEKWIFNILGS